MTNEQFIKKNREQDIRSLALRKVPEGVDALWCMRQIEGYQLALKKLPRWAATEGLHYPPRISMEQCSSESTALYKQQLLSRLTNGKPYTLTDLTGGFGVDFSYMAKDATEAFYVEQQEVLCEAARHNLPLLGITHAHIVNTDSVDYLSNVRGKAIDAIDCHNNVNPTANSIFFLDPARRDDAGRKTVAIEDCTPNIIELQEQLLNVADYVIVKLSPMLDITQALRVIRNVVEVHVVSVKGECKELLLVLSSLPTKTSAPIYHCVNLETPDAVFVSEKQQQTIRFAMPEEGAYLFEPNASILKAGVQEAFAAHYGLCKLHPHSNLYIATVPCDSPQGYATVPCDSPQGIPARSFIIDHILDFSKPSLKKLSKDFPQANITIRNFPSTVAELRKRLKIKEGGSTYIFATTLHDSSHKLLVCRKV